MVLTAATRQYLTQKKNVKVQKLKGGESDTFIVEKFKEVKREIERT